MTKAPSEPTSLPLVSILVPAWNEAKHIRGCIEALLAITWPKTEIIIAAGGSDGTYALSKQYENKDDRVRVIEQLPATGKQSALRALFAQAQGDVLYLTDGDTRVPKETFSAVLAPIIRGEAHVVTGRYRPYQEDTIAALIFYQWSIDRAVERGRSPESKGMTGANAALTRQALEAVDAFNADVPIGTDYHLALRLRTAGFQIRYVDAAVETEYANTPSMFVQRRSRWMRNIFIHGLRYGDRAELIACTRTVALGTSFFLWPLTWPWTKAFGVVTWLLALLGLTGLRWRYARALASETGVPLTTRFLIQLPRFTILDVASWAWPLIDSASRARRFRW